MFGLEVWLMVLVNGFLMILSYFGADDFKNASVSIMFREMTSWAYIKRFSRQFIDDFAKAGLSSILVGIPMLLLIMTAMYWSMATGMGFAYGTIIFWLRGMSIPETGLPFSYLYFSYNLPLIIFSLIWIYFQLEIPIKKLVLRFKSPNWKVDSAILKLRKKKTVCQKASLELESKLLSLKNAMSDFKQIDEQIVNLGKDTQTRIKENIAYYKTLSDFYQLSEAKHQAIIEQAKRRKAIRKTQQHLDKLDKQNTAAYGQAMQAKLGMDTELDLLDKINALSYQIEQTNEPDIALDLKKELEKLMR